MEDRPKKRPPSLVVFALWLDKNRTYQDTKKFFRNLLDNPNYRCKKYIDLFMIALILSSVWILIHEVKHPLPYWVDFYDLYVVTVIFIIEYLLRMWIFSDLHQMIIREYNDSLILGRGISCTNIAKEFFKSKLTYAGKPSAIIDLFAILPGYRPLRVLRIFTLFRLFKLLRYTKSINEFVSVLVEKKFELLTLLFLLLFVVLTAGIAIYIFEAHVNSQINTLFDAMYWALVTISTVGYGDISPVTVGGRVISGVIIISGIAMISFVTSVIVSAFSLKLEVLKENRMIHDLNKREKFLILCGYGQLTKMFLRQMHEPLDYIIVDKEQNRVDEARKDGYHAIVEDISRYEVLSRFDAKFSNITLITLLNNDVENIYITLNAKSVNESIRVIARVASYKMTQKYMLAGADNIFLPDEVASRMLLMAIEQPVMHNAILHLITGTGKAKIDEIAVHGHDHYCCKSISEVSFKEHRLLFVGLYRPTVSEFLFNPAKEMILEEGDVLLVVGYRVSIEQFRKDIRSS